jgi:predicted dehydrogenase
MLPEVTAAMKELNIGIVGLGWVAGAHIETFKSVEGARVTAVCDRRELHETELEQRYGIPLKVHSDFQSMLMDSSIDVIDICTPHPFHPDLAVAAAEAGKHIIIEKPVAIDYESAGRVKAAVNQAGVHTCVCFECRYSKHFTMIRSVIDADLLGQLHYGEVDYYHGIGPWYGQYKWNVKKDMGGSSLLTAGCHALDSLLFFMDSKVVEVACYGSRSDSEIFRPYEYDTTSVTILKFENGSVGKVASSIDCLQPYYFHVHLVGSTGSLLDNKFYSTRLDGLSKEKWSTLETALIDSGDVVDHPYQPQFQAFVESIANDEPMPLTDLETALETHRVAFAADLSAAEGRPVKLSELP